MIKKYALFNVLDVFFRDPIKKYYLREIAKKAKVSTQTAKVCLNWLEKNRFLKKEMLGNLHLFRADYENSTFRYFKTAFNILNIENSGLIEFLKQINPLSIRLYGSYAKGENTSESDIDILLITNSKKKLNLSGYFKKLGVNISIIQCTYNEWRKLSKDNKPFYDETMFSGINLYGNPPVV